MDAQAILDKLGALKDAANVQRVFGEPRTMGDRMVIPVAEVRTGMGFGFGSDKPRGEGEAPKGEGAGGGGGVVARPVGVVEVTPEATTFIPIKSPHAPWAMVLLGVGLGLLLSASGGGCRVNINRSETRDDR